MPFQTRPGQLNFLVIHKNGGNYYINHILCNLGKVFCLALKLESQMNFAKGHCGIKTFCFFKRSFCIKWWLKPASVIERTDISSDFQGKKPKRWMIYQIVFIFCQILYESELIFNALIMLILVVKFKSFVFNTTNEIQWLGLLEK